MGVLQRWLACVICSKLRWVNADGVCGSAACLCDFDAAVATKLADEEIERARLR